MIYKIVCYQGKARYYENEKTFLKYYKQFTSEYERYKNFPGMTKVEAFIIDGSWSQFIPKV